LLAALVFTILMAVLQQDAPGADFQILDFYG
jgi:hypothetical protein